MADGAADGLGPCEEPERLAALRAYGILDTEREPAFDSLVELASRICRTPIAVINLIEDRRQWFKSEVGLGVRETPLDISICRHFLLRPGLTVIPDTRADPRLRDNPLVVGEPGLRFYAGCLLQTAEGHGLGTLCVLDHRPRDLDADQRLALETLAGQVVAQMDLRRALREKQRLLAQRELLLKELNHRVKNNLQLVTSILGLRARSMADPRARAALEDVRGRIRSVAAFHERLYLSDDLETVDLAEYLGGLVGELPGVAGDGGVAVEFRAEPAVVSQAAAVPLALIANELVTNALKHAYAEGGTGGTIRVSLASAGEGRHALTIADDGRGLPQGAEGGGEGRFGMRLLRAMAAQIGASVSAGAGEGGKGARFTVAFPGIGGEA